MSVCSVCYFHVVLVKGNSHKNLSKFSVIKHLAKCTKGVCDGVNGMIVSFSWENTFLKRTFQIVFLEFICLVHLGVGAGVCNGSGSCLKFIQVRETHRNGLKDISGSWLIFHFISILFIFGWKLQCWCDKGKGRQDARKIPCIKACGKHSLIWIKWLICCHHLLCIWYG